jgi:anaerobic selenocysteine-containing dehydrogenase
MPNADRTVLAACPHDCPDTCSMLVTVRGDRAVSVRGNPDHPFTRGRLCVKVNNYTDRVYSRDRVLEPLRRSGTKGSGRFEPISWARALDEIRVRWMAIIDRHGPTAILPYSYLGTQGILNGLNAGDPFFNRLGATISERTFCDSGSSTAYLMTVGPTPGTDPESFKHAKYVILWACNTISTNLHHWPIIAEAQQRGAKVVVVDPIRSRTAREADWHVAIRPGTDAALALGMIDVVVREDLIDRDYVAQHTIGYEELCARAAEYPAERVEKITGILAADVRRLAREYATTQPSVIRLGVALERHASGGNAVRALTCLPALVGSWRHVGGGILQNPVWAFPVRWDRLTRADWIRPGTRVLNQWRLGAALTGEIGLDPPIQALFVYNSNPAIVSPGQTKILAGLAREDLFTVVSEQFVSDTARYADIVLPATTQLEQFDLMFSWGHLYLSLNMPAIAPLGDAVPNTELFRRLAATFGFDDAHWQRTDERMADEAIDWSAPALAGVDMDLLKREGYARLRLPDEDTYAPHAEGRFPTRSGKCELKASMALGGNFVLPIFRQGSTASQAGDALDPLPSYAPPVETADADPSRAARFPLRLLSPKSHPFLNSSYGNLPAQLRHAGEQTVLMHPADGAARGVREGSTVRVWNDRGTLEGIATLTRDVMPGVVVVPMGYWLKPGGLGTVNALSSERFADYGRAPTFSDNLVEVGAADP